MIIVIFIFFMTIFYTYIRVILPLHLTIKMNIILGILLVTISLMHNIFDMFGDRFIPYSIQRPILIISGILFNFFIFIFLLTLLKDILLLVKNIITRILSMQFNIFTSKQVILVTCIVSIFLSVYSLYEALKIPKVVTHEVKIKDLPEELKDVKIGLLTDMHLSIMNKREFTEKCVDKMNNLHPDLILITGDLSDGYVKDRRDSLDPLKDLKSKYGVYGVDGNHDYYWGYDDWIKKYKSLGIDMLQNENRIIDINNSQLAIVGLRDNAKENNIKNAVSGINKSMPTILMAHGPKIANITKDYNIDLQLSGHTHGGMMPLFSSLVAKLNGGYVSGWYDVDNMKLYVSNGTALWHGFSIRLGVPSEITIFILKKDNN